MRKTTRRYGSYRGRSTATQRLRWVAGVLAVLVCLAGAGLLYGQKYIVYTDDGPRLDLPFLSREEETPPPLDPQDLQVVVEQQEEPEQEEPAQSVQEAEPWLRAVTLAPDQADLGAKARELGANGVILDMKTDWGALNYVSDQLLAPEQSGDY